MGMLGRTAQTWAYSVSYLFCKHLRFQKLWRDFFFSFLRFYLLIHERHRERGRGRGRSRFPTRNPMWLHPRSWDLDLRQRQMLNCWAIQASLRGVFAILIARFDIDILFKSSWKFLKTCFQLLQFSFIYNSVMSF